MSTCTFALLDSTTSLLVSFNASRVPVTPADVPVTYPAAQNEHIIVLRKGRYYKVDTAGRGAAELAAAFKHIKQLADAQDEPAPIGVLTVDDRDVWTEVSGHK
jgi:carnitine O-acetyltransferase